MRKHSSRFTFWLGILFALPALGATVYNNLTPTNGMAIATRPESSSSFEIEAADDFVLPSRTFITSASFVGMIVAGTSGVTPIVTEVGAEIYRVFPLDSNTIRTVAVPTRVNSPSDVAVSTKDSAAGQLTFTTSILSSSFTALNSIQPGSIHASPNQTTGGSGPITGTQVLFTLTFASAFDVVADHYFFVPQVALSNGGQFYWLSGTRPISGAGLTPFTPDLQVWTRDELLGPDWLRVGTDIVGGSTPPMFNAAFSLEGTAVPEPRTAMVVLAGFSCLLVARRFRIVRK